MTLEVTITVTNEFRARIWIGSQLIRFAAWIMGCGINVEEKKSG